MAIGTRFAKWGLGLFIFGVLLSFGVIAHYCAGSRWPNGELFMKNITLWWACPWTLSVAAVQAGGLGMVALGLTLMLGAREPIRRYTIVPVGEPVSPTPERVAPPPGPGHSTRACRSGR
jgi:hypothetical protein